MIQQARPTCAVDVRLGIKGRLLWLKSGTRVFCETQSSLAWLLSKKKKSSNLRTPKLTWLIWEPFLRLKWSLCTRRKSNSSGKRSKLKRKSRHRQQQQSPRSRSPRNRRLRKRKLRKRMWLWRSPWRVNLRLRQRKNDRQYILSNE